MKIAICTPSHGQMHSEFTYSMIKMIMHTLRSRILFNGEEVAPDIELFTRSSSMLPTVRNLLVMDALDWGANYLLFADADHSFPPGSLMRLLSLNLPVVGVNYARRTSPTYPTAKSLNDELAWTTEELAWKGEVSEVKSLGLGFCLIDMSIFPALYDHAVAAGKENFWPLFSFEAVPGSHDVLGEDAYFFRQLREAGIQIYVDHALSWSVLHMHQKALSNADTIAEKDAFLERLKG